MEVTNGREELNDRNDVANGREEFKREGRRNERGIIVSNITDATRRDLLFNFLA